MNRPEILVTNGELASKRFQVPPGGLRLGRSSSNDVHIADEELSRNHCLFEEDGENGIRVLDLASANGTFVNGVQLDGDAKRLAVGDEIVAGRTTLRIVDEHTSTDEALAKPAAAPVPRGGVDLGLESPAAGKSAERDPANPGMPRNRLANILWGIVAILLASAIAIVFLAPNPADKKARLLRPAAAPAAAEVSELYYEKVEADSAHIFRYELSLDRDGLLRVAYDDVPGENRHIEKTAKLSENAQKRINEIFSAPGWDELDEAYTGASARSENALKSRRIRVVKGTKIHETLVENSNEPEVFAKVCSALEAFTRNELGVWALQYSRAQLIENSAEAEKTGDARFAEAEVEYRNLSEALAAYKEAAFYLETVNPKPENYEALKDKLSKTREALDAKYREHRFLANKAINLGDWAEAKEQLGIILQLISNDSDERYTEARAKLMDVENRLKTKKAKGANK